MKTLRDVRIGDTVKVVKLHGEGAVKRRIMDMGLTKGVDVSVRKVAPLGDPIKITVRRFKPPCTASRFNCMDNPDVFLFFNLLLLLL